MDIDRFLEYWAKNFVRNGSKRKKSPLDSIELRPCIQGDLIAIGSVALSVSILRQIPE